MKWSFLIPVTLLLVAVSCSDNDPAPGKTVFSARAARRAFDGAPPVVPHQPIGVDCTECHTLEGKEVPEMGFAPANPHVITKGMSMWARCTQCHVFKNEDTTFRESSFIGKAQTYSGGSRQHSLAPPRIPHRVFMRENCLACHSGVSARKELTTTHPFRKNCRQCHVPKVDDSEFK